jgi:hypothetical protein
MKPALAYLGALKSFHVETGMSVTAFRDPYLNLIIQGGKRIYGEGAKAKRYPITSDILHMSTKSGMTKRESMSKRLSMWALPPPYDLENSGRILGPRLPLLPSLARSRCLPLHISNSDSACVKNRSLSCRHGDLSRMFSAFINEQWRTCDLM